MHVHTDALEIEMQYACTACRKFGGKDAGDFKHMSVCIFTLTLAFREQLFTVGFGLSLAESLALFHCAWLPSSPPSV